MGGIVSSEGGCCAMLTVQPVRRESAPNNAEHAANLFTKGSRFGKPKLSYRNRLFLCSLNGVIKSARWQQLGAQTGAALRLGSSGPAAF